MQANVNSTVLWSEMVREERGRTAFAVVCLWCTLRIRTVLKRMRRDSGNRRPQLTFFPKVFRTAYPPVISALILGFTLLAQAQSVTLAWDPNPESNILGYRIYRSTTSGSSYSRLNSSLATSTSFTDNTVGAGKTYFYVVTAVNSLGLESGYSNQVSTTIAGALSVNAGSDTVVREGLQVKLSGSASDPSGGTLSYQWSQVSGPSVSLQQSGQPVATFTAPAVTAQTLLVFRLTATSSNGATASDSVQVTVNPNLAPVVDAGPDLTRPYGSTVLLQGTASDPNGDSLIITWRQVDGIPVQLSSSSGLNTSFTAPVQDAVLVFELSASDGLLTSVSQTTILVVEPDLPPVVDAGPDQSVTGGTTVTLHGSAVDPEGQAVTYSWAQVSGPQVVLQNPASSTPSFTAPGPTQTTVLTFELTASDPKGDMATDRTSVTVTLDAAPIVEAETLFTVNSRSVVGLSADATDPEGKPLSIRWSQSRGPTVQLTDSRAAQTFFKAPSVASDTLLTFGLDVSDGTSVVHRSVSVTIEPGLPRSVLFPVSLNSGDALFQDTFVGVALYNSGQKSNEVVVSEKGGQGKDVNYKILGSKLSPGGQNALLTSEIVSGNIQPSVLLAEGMQAPVQGFFLAGDNSLNRLDGIGGKLPRSATLYFPLIRQTSTESTLLFLHNPNESDLPTVHAELRLPDGSLLEQADLALAAGGSVELTVSDLFQLRHKVDGGYVIIQTDKPVQGFEFEADKNEFVALKGEISASETLLYSPQFFLDGNGGNTEIHLLNADSYDAEVTVKIFDDSDALLSSDSYLLPAAQMLSVDGTSLLSWNPSMGTLTGHIEIKVLATKFGRLAPSTLGYVIFSGNHDRIRCALPLVADGGTETRFLHVAQSTDLGLFTGLAILNPGTQEAQLTVSAFAEDGSLTAQRSLKLAPGHRISELLTSPSFFGGSFSQVKGYLHLTSNVPVVPFAIFGDYRMQFLGAIEGQGPVK